MKCEIDKEETVSFNKKEKGEVCFWSGTLGSTKEWVESVRRTREGSCVKKTPLRSSAACRTASPQLPETGGTKSALDGNWKGAGYLDVDPSHDKCFSVSMEPKTQQDEYKCNHGKT